MHQSLKDMSQTVAAPWRGGMLCGCNRSVGLGSRRLRARMTKADFINAKRSFKRQISWLVTLWFVLWLIAFFSIGAGFRYWFHEHATVSALVLAAAVLIFIVPVAFISRRLHERHGLVCRSCGHRGFLSDSGQCVRCQSVIYDAA